MLLAPLRRASGHRIENAPAEWISEVPI